MNPVGATTVVPPARVCDAAPRAIVPTLDALPSPRDATASGLNDAMSMLYALVAKDGQTQVESRKHEIDQHRHEREKALPDEKAAFDRQRKAEGEESTGFFGSIVKIVKDVVDDATHLRVADAVSDVKDDCEAAWNSPRFWHDLESGARSLLKGIDTVIALATAVALDRYDDALVIIEHPDSDTARHYALAGKIALAVAATVATAGAATSVVALAAAAMSAGGEVVADTRFFGSASAYVALGLEVGGGVVALATGNASEAQKTLEALRGAEKMVEGSAMVVEGMAHARSADFDGDAESALADAKAAAHRAERIDRLVKQILTETKDVAKSHERALDAIRGAIETNNQTLLVAAGVRG
jgi:hypothetical protein